MAVNENVDYPPAEILLVEDNPNEVELTLRVDSRTCMIPVVVLTSSRQERDITEKYRLGVNSYIVKPVKFDRFTEVVAQLGYSWLVVNQLPPLPQGAMKP